MGLRPKWPISAYNASAPVKASTTAAKMVMPMPGWAIKKFAAHQGFNACNTCGSRMMPEIPRAPSTTNHSTITGPKRIPMRAVPCFWIRNSPTSNATVIGTTQCSRPGSATFMPSTAESTEMAGVIMLSP